MKERLWLSAVAVLAVVGSLGCDTDVMIYGPNPQVAKAEQRVTGMLDGLQQGGDTMSAHLQTAICKWYNGQGAINDSRILDKAWLDFDDWRMKKGLYDKRIGSFEIVESAVVPDSDPTEVTMTVIIDGTKYRMLVPDGKPIRWMN